MKPDIPITIPFMDDEEKRLAGEAIASGWVAQGPMVGRFEELVAAYTGAKHAVAVSSCTAALHVTLVALRIGPGDEVIVPSLSFIASANAVRHAGALPVFVDIDPTTYNIDPARIEAAITGATRAIMPVHQIGLSCEMDAIRAIAKKHNLLIIEDGACAIGSLYRGKRLGGESPAFAMSFHPRKVITTGEGGMVLTNDAALERKLRLLRHHGMSVSDLDRHKAGGLVTESYELVGYNYRMSDVQAALGVAQMAKLDYILERRRTLADRYSQAFSHAKGLAIPREPDYARHNWQSYMPRVTSEAKITRDGLMARLLARGIATRRGIMAIHRELAYKAIPLRHPLPETERANDECIILPLYPSMTESQQNRVIEQVLAAVG